MPGNGGGSATAGSCAFGVKGACAEAGRRAQDYELNPDSWDLAEGVEGGSQEAIAEYHERMCKARRGHAGRA